MWQIQYRRWLTLMGELIILKRHMKTLKRKFKKHQNKKLKKKSKVDIIVKDILRRAYIQDMIEAILYILILSPIMIVLVIKASSIVQVIVFVLFLSCFYFVFL